MRLHAIILIVAISCTGLNVSAVEADELVMKTGERFSSDRVWEENGKIRFNMQGLLVSVDKDEVAAVIRKDGGLQNNSSQAPQQSRSPARGKEEPGATHFSSNKDQRRTNQLTDSQKHAAEGRGPKAPSQRNHLEHGTGLKNVSWKMKPEAMGGLVKIKTEPTFGGIDQYSRPDEALKVGDALLDGVAYGFWRNQLYSIMMWVDGRIGYRRLKDELFHQFGQGSQNKPEVERYIWLEDKTQRMLEFDTDLNMGIFVMRSAEIDDQIKKQYPN
jgi:hypothetical protein